MLNKSIHIFSERAVLYAEKLAIDFFNKKPIAERKEKGQYITSPGIADFMSSLCTIKQKEIFILDPGAGTGILSCSICEHLALSQNKPDLIHLTLYENDTDLIAFLEESMNYLKYFMELKGIKIKYLIINDDFILSNQNALDIYNEHLHINLKKNFEKFDLIISNPPYFKILKSDPRAQAASTIVHGQPNIYALFMAVAAALLKINGELIFITPRSYTAGHYFELFRKKFFSIIYPSHFHLFHSRKEAFSHEDILQENIILKGIRLHDTDLLKDKTVTITSSNGSIDLSNNQKRTVKLDDIIINKKSRIYSIPTNEEEEKIIELFKKWNNNLKSFGIKISTGPVVPFRAVSVITEKPKDLNESVPLIWMNNIKPLIINWPIPRKKQYMIFCEESIPLLVKNKNYVLLRRFSTKEEDRRLIAAPFLADNFQTEYIGLENHLNYLYRPETNLSIEETYGLSALFNSRLFDLYFRTFNGNTQVSATELRTITLPALDKIIQIGKQVLENSISIDIIDNIVQKTLTGGEI